MPTRKIGELPTIPAFAPAGCRNPEHNPPQHMLYEDGVYEHTCPGCFHKTVFTVSKPTWV